MDTLSIFKAKHRNSNKVFDSVIRLVWLERIGRDEANGWERDFQFHSLHLTFCEELPEDLTVYDAVVVVCRLEELGQWISRVNQQLPVFWYGHGQEGAFRKWNLEADGFIDHTMNESQILGMLLLGCYQFERRKGLMIENKKLKVKLEQRKLIDRAKEIVAELNHVSLSKAYELMRMQAMKERRSIESVARSLLSLKGILPKEKDAN
ncbi:ANTAR domain-containing response regulator [Ammoniphilus sp. YIM 78166]|uniref:ANTAR domain-containing response regulator n=1 Tax=Ammoniphilus sp. YIM 78166 TaxID=1644106 RepID=UPI001431B9AE|nr:ANTAR domain-containing protein [Ammoniphilus sp. YIM 78166]